MKLCIIGNSHAAMLIAALADNARQTKATIFAKPNLVSGDVEMNGSVIRAVSETLCERLERYGTAKTLDLNDFDLVVFVAMAPSVFSVARMTQTHVVSTWPSGRKAVVRTLSGTPPKRSLLSRAALRDALVALTQGADAYRLAKALRMSSEVPLAIVPQPFPSADLFSQNKKYPVLRRIQKAGDGHALADDLALAYRAAFEPMGGVSVLTQPEISVRDGCFGDPEFMRGAIRLSLTAKQPDKDILHGNARLGGLYLEQLTGKAGA